MHPPLGVTITHSQYTSLLYGLTTYPRTFPTFLICSKWEFKELSLLEVPLINVPHFLSLQVVSVHWPRCW